MRRRRSQESRACSGDDPSCGSTREPGRCRRRSRARPHTAVLARDRARRCDPGGGEGRAGEVGLPARARVREALLALRLRVLGTAKSANDADALTNRRTARISATTAPTANSAAQPKNLTASVRLVRRMPTAALHRSHAPRTSPNRYNAKPAKPAATITKRMAIPLLCSTSITSAKPDRMTGNFNCVTPETEETPDD